MNRPFLKHTVAAVGLTLACSTAALAQSSTGGTTTTPSATTSTSTGTDRSMTTGRDDERHNYGWIGLLGLAGLLGLRRRPDVTTRDTMRTPGTTR